MKKCWYFSVAFSAKFFWFLKTFFKIISQSLSPSQKKKNEYLKDVLTYFHEKPLQSIPDYYLNVLMKMKK